MLIDYNTHKKVLGIKKRTILRKHLYDEVW